MGRRRAVCGLLTYITFLSGRGGCYLALSALACRMSGMPRIKTEW